MSKASPAGPWADYPDGYCESAGGVVSKGHLLPRKTAYLARDILTDPESTPDRRDIAFHCLRSVVDTQIRKEMPHLPIDPRGTWFWAADDSDGRGVSWNWEDFIGTRLEMILRSDVVPDHSDWPAGLLEDVQQCLIRAIRASHTRHVRISYTNPVAMSIECSALTGELLGIPEFVEYARERLKEWIAFTDEAGGFEEFNSSTYGGVTLPHVARLAEHVQDEEIRQMALSMERRYFQHILDFYHHPTGEMCLPRSRSYLDHFETSLLYAYLSAVSQDRASGAFPPPPSTRDELCMDLNCHIEQETFERLTDDFATPRETRMYCEWIGRDHVGPVDQIPHVGGPGTRRRLLSARRVKEFCIGTVNELDCWYQRRLAGGYIRHGSGNSMVHFQPIITIEGVDQRDHAQQWPTMMYFNHCSGLDNSTILAGLTSMPVNAGWLCGSHWRQKVAGTVRGVYVDFGIAMDNLPDGLELPEMHVDKPWRIPLGETVVTVLLMGGSLAGRELSPTIERDGNSARLVFLRADNLDISWDAPPEASLAWVLDFSPAGSEPDLTNPSFRFDGGVLESAVGRAGRRLTLRYDPPTLADLTREACVFEAMDSA